MRIIMAICITVVSVALTGTISFLVFGCTLNRPAPFAGATAEPGNPTDSFTDASRPVQRGSNQPAVVRVGGDPQTRTDFKDGVFHNGVCRITTPLPTGYPPPTPPGAMEMKDYPLVRRAAISGSMSPDWGMNLAFFPLFNHIKRREIAMTSPVEVNYERLGGDGAEKPRSWTMSFLYRTPNLGRDGVDSKDDRILIEDIPPMTVLAIGMRGPYKLKQVNQGLETLRAWLSQQSEWEEADDPRALFYNGPEMGPRDKWSEVQIPLRRK